VNDMQTSPEAALHARYGAEQAPTAVWNDVIATLLAHRSVRAFTDAPLPAGTLEILVAAAQSAATSSNMQTWSVVAVEDAGRKALLAEWSGRQAHVAHAPLVLVWLADLSRAARIGAARGHDMVALPYTETAMVAMIDAALAAQNATVAAESLGLGTVYLGALRNRPEDVAAELYLPAQCFPVFGLCVGWPDPSHPSPLRPRLPQSVVLHRERYDTTHEADGIAVYDERFTAHQQAEGIRPVGWSSRVLDRLGAVRGLNGRERMRTVLAALGFPLD